jgi:hypothetical protein
MSRKPRTIDGQFAPRTIEMMMSPAYRSLNLTERRILDRLEIELARHGGKDNGKLVVTYEQFIEYGVRKDSITLGLRKLVTTGFIEVTEKGRAGTGPWRRPNKIRLTYRPAFGNPPTNNWRVQPTVGAYKKNNFRPPHKTGVIITPPHKTRGGTTPQNGGIGTKISTPRNVGYSLDSSPSRGRAEQQADGREAGGESQPGTEPQPAVSKNRETPENKNSGADTHWAEAQALLVKMRRPDDIPDRQWNQLRNDFARFCDRWANQAEVLSWQPRDILGWDVRYPYSPTARRIGLAWKFDGATVVEVRLDGIMIERRPGFHTLVPRLTH